MASESSTRVIKRGKKKPNRKRGWNYPRAGYGPIRRWLPSWRVLVASVFAIFGLGFGAVATLYATIDIPAPADFAVASTTKIYYSDGTTELGTLADYQREPVTLDQVPEYLQKGVVASEDASFYTNSGVSPRGILRAFVNNITGGRQQGGSTLTQQYVERYYLGTTKGYVGKAKEALLAMKINRQESKEQILENYLNTIYFGRGAYGVEMAAQKYFGTSVKALNLSQSALLVAVIPSPSGWDPAVNREMAEAKWNRVLDRMVGEGYLSQSERDQQTFPETIAPSTSNSFSGTNGYLMSTVVNELVAMGKFTVDDLNQKGLKIVTTINKTMQEAAVDSVNKLPKDRPSNNYVGLISTDPRNGEIYALYGGADYLVRQRNSVTQDHAQAGSTFKPFGLLAALKQGISLNKTFDSTTPKKFGAIEVNNFDDKSRGMVNLVTATKYSINTAYVGLNNKIGPANTKAAAIEAGLPADTPGLDDTLTNVLGSASPRAIDMAKAYSTFANKGKTTTPHIVRTVIDRSGATVFQGDTGGVQAVDADIVAQMNVALQATTRGDGTAKTAGKLDRPVAGKTGTSSDTRSAWFIGYVPQMLTAVNMYQVGPNGEEEALTGFGKYWYGIGGGSFPAEIWLRYMETATEDMDVMTFDKPAKASAVPEATSTTEAEVTPTPEQTESTEAPTVEAPQPVEESPVTPSPEQTQPADPPQTQPSANGNGSGNNGVGNGASHSQGG